MLQIPVVINHHQESTTGYFQTMFIYLMRAKQTAANTFVDWPLVRTSVIFSFFNHDQLFGALIRRWEGLCCPLLITGLNSGSGSTDQRDKDVTGNLQLDKITPNWQKNWFYICHLTLKNNGADRPSRCLVRWKQPERRVSSFNCNTVLSIIINVRLLKSLSSDKLALGDESHTHTKTHNKS